MMQQISLSDLANRLLALPPHERATAVALMQRVYPAELSSGSTGRDVDQRRGFAGDPWRYFRDVLGWTLTPQQERALGLIETSDRVLIPAGNNIGKTFLIAAYGVYRMDAVAALPDEERGTDEQGAQVLLPGPDAATIFATVYQAMLEHAARAESRGYPMPGLRSDRSVLWFVRPRWFVEAFSPPQRVGQDVSHTASGRHHRNQVALLEEGQGVPERVWRAVEGMCSGAGNKIISSFNPTEDVGPASQRERAGSYRALHLSAFDHPNIELRRSVIPDAVDYLVIDGRVRDECRDHGPYPARQPDPNEGDFLYALPPLDAPEHGPRADGVRGHPDAPVHVFRPGGFFEPQVFGRWPRSLSNALCDPAAWDAAVARGKACPDPEAPPDRVGLDPAREGLDDPCAVPSWGESAEALLRRRAEIIADRKDPSTLPRIRVGPPWILRKGDGVDLAEQVAGRYPKSPANVDEGGVGTSALDHGRRVLRLDWAGVSFGATPPAPLPGEPWCENMRTSMYVRAGMLTTFGLVDLPDDPLLREEFLAHWTELRWRVVETRDPQRGLIKERKPSLLLCSKDLIKKRIGRSPDRADGFVLSLLGGPKVVFEYLAAPGPTRRTLFDRAEDDDGDGAGRWGGRMGRFGPGGW